MLEAHCLVCEAYQLSEVVNHTYLTRLFARGGGQLKRKWITGGREGYKDKECCGVLEHSTCTCICGNQRPLINMIMLERGSFNVKGTMQCFVEHMHIIDVSFMP